LNRNVFTGDKVVKEVVIYEGSPVGVLGLLAVVGVVVSPQA
jgi:hypothetical protein